MANYIIDPVNDTAYYTEVRDLLGVTSDDLSDDTLKSDIFLGAAERMICKLYVPNWQAVLTGSDAIAADSLRSSVVIRVAQNILNMPANQNLLFDQIRLIDIILIAKKQTIEDLKSSLQSLFEQQLSFIGVERTSAWPERTLVGKSTSADVYDYHIDTEGAVQES